MSPKDSTVADFFDSTPGVQLLASFDPDTVPSHVAIIMDGNGRWAASRGLPRLAGHRAGAKAVREIIATALELNVRVLTIYSFSSENWSRPEDEVSGLMSLFVEVLEREFDNLQKQGVRVVVAGHKSELPDKTARSFGSVEERTAGNDRLTLVVALNYGGRTEIVDATKAIARQVAAGVIGPDEIDESVLADNMYTRTLPDPDLVVRTSGEMRISNFLLWQVAYSEFYVTDTLWPDFDRTEFLRAIVDFQHRDRRFGGR